MSSHTAITVTIAVISGLFGLTFGYYQNMNEGISRQPDVSHSVEQIALDAVTVPIKGSPMRGGQNAVATIVVFTDFTAPATKPLYTQHLDHAFRIHGDKIAVVYKAYPLQSNTNNGNDALLRAKLAQAAKLQDKFWNMADKLIDYGTQPLSMEKGLELALAAGLDTKKLAKDIDSPQVLDAIRADIQLGKSLGLTGAPSLFVNGKEIVFSDKITQKTLMDGINAELKRMSRLAAQPAANYYLGSLVNQQLDAIQSASDDLGRPVRGAKNALVTIVEYSDYECPFCSRVEPTLARILREYPDSVRIVFSHHPLPFHKNAMRAHQAAYAAGKQGKFWEMHDLLFKNQKSLTDSHLMQYARELGLDMKKFQTDIDAPETRDAIQKNLKEATEKNISGTPNFLINGVALTGAQPYENFKKIIEQELKKAKLVQHEHKGLSGDKLYAEIMKTAPKTAPKDAAPAGRIFVETGNAPILGNPNAPITIVEFTDFECPFCSRANTTLHQLLTEYPDKIRIVFKNNPLSFHKNANAAHRAALAAQAQGKFREMHDLLFANQKSLSAADLEKYASQIGLDLNRFRQDMESEAIKTQVEEDLSSGQHVGVRGTPHFFINGKRLSGAQPIDQFRAVIDDELKLAQPLLERNLTGEALYKAIVEQNSVKALRHSRRPFPKNRMKPMAQALDHNAAPVALEIGDSYARGPENAPVTIYQFSEFQCPFCSRVEPTLNELLAAYPGKIRIIFKSFPLTIHKNAKIASEAALAAGAQDKFWEMHELLFQNQKQLNRENLTDYARQLGLNVEKFDAELDAHVYAPQVDLETKQGQSAGVSGTPTFFINGKILKGAQSLSAFKTAVDEALNQTP